MNSKPQTVKHHLALSLELGPRLEPMRELLEQFLRRRLHEVLGWRVRNLTSVHANMRSEDSAAVTCRICAIANHKTSALGITTAADLQTAIEVAVERVGFVLGPRTGAG